MFKTVGDLKNSAKLKAQEMTLDAIRKDVAAKIEAEAIEGGHEVEYFISDGVDVSHLTAIAKELCDLGYQAYYRGKNQNYQLLTINWS